MEKHISGLLIVIAAVFLLVGGLVGYDIGEAQIETNTITETVYQNVSVTEIEYIYAPSVLDKAIEDFLVAIEDEEVLYENDTEADILGNYNFNELEVSRIFDDYIVSYYDDLTTVNYTIKLKFDDGDERLRQTYEVSVISEEDEDTIVLIA